MSLLRRKSKVKESPSTSAQGCVFIPNRDAYLLEYKENLIVKDVVESVCRHLELLPVTWPFFGMCPNDTDYYLYPYDNLTIEDCTKDYRLRVMVNVGPNCFHFKYLDDRAFNFFFNQVQQDFLNGKLDGMAVDYMYWMGGIDMARRAQEEKTDFKGLLQNYVYHQFLPLQCLRKMKRARKVVIAAFDKFYNNSNPLSDGKLKLKYLEIAEKSSVLEYHTCQATMDTDDGKITIKLWISVKKGIEKEVLTDDSGPPAPMHPVCQLADINFIETSYRTVGSSTKWIAKVVCKPPVPPAQVSGQHEHHFMFNRKEELVSFCIVVNTLYVLTVNCNACILEGSLKPPECYLKITERDPVNSKICHGLISRDAVHSILLNEGMDDGLYLVRKSRQRVNSYTLHVCLNNRIRNFEVKMNNEGKLYILPNATFESLLKLVYYYHKDKHGLPVPLLRILPPEKTRPIPLLDKDPKTLKGHANTSPDAVGTTSPAFPFPGEAAASSGSSTSSDDSGLPSNNDSLFNFTQQPHASNGFVKPNPVPANSSTIQWELSSFRSNRAMINPIMPANPLMTSAELHPHQTMAPQMGQPTGMTRVFQPPLSLLNPSSPPIDVKPPVHTIDHTQLKRGKELGQGHFSHVYKGEYTDDRQRTLPVAIKVLKKKSMPEDGGVAEAELLKEADNMAALDHTHIVKFLGISHSLEDELMLITEFVPCGDLRKYLKKYKDQRQEIPMSRLLKFSNQIADGMSYLESMRIVHRDLAARNILVQNDNCVKISDFGLARQLNLQKNSDYYRVHDPRNASLPLWWYAPESISEWKFTSANDVWSFGVTLWEIFSYGGTPKLEDIRANDRMEIYTHLVNGKRLKKPRTCPDEVYQLMLDHCWNLMPTERMKFAGLSVELMLIQNRS